MNIGGNELSRVPTEALRTMDNLKKLEIQENKITAISEGDFIGTYSLDYKSLFIQTNIKSTYPAFKYLLVHLVLKWIIVIS